MRSVFVLPRERFERLVADALDSLPTELGKSMENIVVLVEDRANGRPLFGLYEGIPLTKRGPQSYSGVMPDRITLYQETICQVCSTEARSRSPGAEDGGPRGRSPLRYQRSPSGGVGVGVIEEEILTERLRLRPWSREDSRSSR